ncbi:MAG TPA: FkbM family methyltransferase [Casimicrobiaceae bacterium]|jgi:FkbM family methyltransferase
MGPTDKFDESPVRAQGDASGGSVDGFVSYAQNYEDVRLWQALQHVEKGTYIDVGAQDPDADSVTRAFYDRGWSGINIEPVAAYHERLTLARPRDINLCVAAAASGGQRDFFEIENTGLSTLRQGVAQRHLAAGFKVTKTQVNVRTLRDIWTEFVRGEVHFLKIDVEGAEKDVLAGADLRQQRPWIVVIEATAPMTGTPTHEKWESLLTTAGYRFVLSDDLNRYYVADEQSQLAEALRTAAVGPAFGRDRSTELTALLLEQSGGEKFDARRSLFLGLDHPTPTLQSPTSQLCTESQLREPVYLTWCDAMREAPTLHRKQWEFVYILQALASRGMLEPGRRGLGFGCGREPLAAVMANRGCEIVATDLDATAAAGLGWIETDQHSSALEELNVRGICDPEQFSQRVSFRTEDMNRISPELQGFDFVWSSCAFEHLGSIRRGLDFVVNAMRCLRPGGVAVHTTEFNLTSNYRTIEAHNLVFFRRYDIEQLIGALKHAGHVVAPLNLNPGSGSLDRFVDLPPYRSEPHLRLRMDRYVATSIGLIIERGV